MQTININGNPKITFKWSICKGGTTNPEDFTGASLFIWLVGVDNKYFIQDFTIGTDGSVDFVVDTTSISAGVYGVKAFWVKDSLVIKTDLQNNDKRMMSEVRNLVMFTRTALTGIAKTIAIRSYAASYGYDGYSAYEMAVITGKTTLDESEWLDVQTQAAEMYSELDSKIDTNTETLDSKIDTNTETLQAEIEELQASLSTQSFTVNPSVFFYGEATTVTVSGTSNKTMSECQIKKAGTTLKEATNTTSIEFSETLTATAIYTFTGKIGSASFISKTAQATAVFPIYVGFSEDDSYTGQENDLEKQSARSGLGTLNVTVTNDSTNKYFWIMSPYKVSKVTTSGINIFSDFIASSTQIQYQDYYCYRLSAKSAVGSFTFEIS